MKTKSSIENENRKLREALIRIETIMELDPFGVTNEGKKILEIIGYELGGQE